MIIGPGDLKPKRMLTIINKSIHRPKDIGTVVEELINVYTIKIWTSLL